MHTEAWNREDRQNIRYYTDSIAQHGDTVQALDWGSRESQQRRFSVLAQVGRLDGASVLDVGCGMGDLYGWLRERNIAVEYTGTDITPQMIDIARRRFPRARFRQHNLLEDRAESDGSYDFVFASGIFTFRKTAPFAFLKTMVEQMYCRCTKAMAFNSLSSWAPLKDRGEYYADPLKTLAFCRTLTPRVVLWHDYHPRDFTLYLYKSENS